MVRMLFNVLLLLGIITSPALSGEVEVPGGGIMRLEITLAPDQPQPVAGEMVLVIIRAVYDLKVANEKLELTTGSGLDWIQMQPDHWFEAQIDGLPRLVMERYLAVWPKTAGMMQIGPARHNLTVIDRQSQRQDITVTAKPLSFSVGEYPNHRGWHFTAKQLELTEELDADPGRLEDGQMLTRKIRLRALGALPEHLPPRPVVSENWLITFAPPPERALYLTEAGPVAEVVWTWQLRPHTGEPGVLDAETIRFFDTGKRALSSVEIPALPLAYASFFTGQVPVGKILTGQKLLFALALFLALLSGLGFAALFLAPPAGCRALAQLGASWNPRLRWQLWQARRAGDLLTERRLAGQIGLSAARLARIDQRIYSVPGPAAPPR